MKPLIIANWKLNPASRKEASQLFDAVKKGVKAVKDVEVVICPPFVHLPLFSGLTLGAQDVFYKEKGAFTGEVSPLMLADLGVEYVIIGHSERRLLFSESNDSINKKIKGALMTGLKPVVCVGEQEGQEKHAVIEEQVREAFKGLSAGQAAQVAVAYEPVWAIGTGKNCSPNETLKSLLLIRKIITGLYNRETAEKVRILYGGSVKAGNAPAYLKEAMADGLLVGGASLDAAEFTEIVRAVRQP